MRLIVSVGLIFSLLVFVLSCATPTPSPKPKLDLEQRERLQSYSQTLEEELYMDTHEWQNWEKEKITIAVLDFENNTSGGQKAELDALRTGLTDMFITELMQIPIFKVIERTRLSQVANELALPDLAGVDADTAQQIGRLVGAQVLYYGSFMSVVGQFNLNARLVRVETGEIISATSKRMKYDPDTILDLVDKVGFDLSKTANDKQGYLLADVFYSKGVVAEEEEDDYEKALEYYQKALERDSENQAARSAVQRLSEE